MHIMSKFSRRRLLGGGAAAAALAPFVPMLDSHAGVDGVPTRVILVYTPTGTVLPRWRPTGTEDAWTLSEILSPLADRKSDIIVLDGVDDEAAHHLDFHPQGWGYGGHHAIASLWTGRPALRPGEDTVTSTGQSVDHFIGERFAGETPFRTLQFGVDNPDDDYWKNRMSFSAAQTPESAINDPALMFATIFGDPSLDPEALEQLKAGRLSVLDSVLGDLDRLANRTSKSDKMKIEAHLDAVRQLEEQIQGGLSGCSVPVPQELVGHHAGYDVDTTNMMQLMVDALACDATRVATLMFGNENSNADFPFLDLGVDDSRLHGMSHFAQSGDIADAFVEVQQWWMGKYKQLLDMLAAKQTADGTLLEHTVVVWTSSISVGWNHSSRNLPIVLAGQGGGYFTTDRYHQWGGFAGTDNSHREHGGRTMNDLLLSVIHAAGLTDVETFGDPAFCTGPLL